MEIAKIADRFSELMTINKKKSMEKLQNELKGMTDKHRLAARWLKSSQYFLEDIAVKPSKTELKTLESKKIKVKDLKSKPWESCLEGFEVVSDLRGEEANSYSNGLILKKGSEKYYAACVDFSDTGAEKSDALDTFIERFEKTIKITKHASEKGVALPIEDIHICFHAQGYMGYIVFKASKTMQTWHEYSSKEVKGNFFTKKNRLTMAEKASELVPIAMEHIKNLHENGIILSFRGYGWIDTSSIIIDFDSKGKPTSVHPINFISSALIEDVVKDSIRKDFEILHRLQSSSENAYELRDKAAEVSAITMVDEGLLK